MLATRAPSRAPHRHNRVARRIPQYRESIASFVTIGFVISVAAFILTLLIGLSRLYLGVHFLSDVIAGYAGGAVWLAACVSGVEIALRQRGLAPWEVGIERRRTPRRPAESSRSLPT